MTSPQEPKHERLRVLMLENDEADAALIRRMLARTAPAASLRWAKNRAEFIRELEDFRPEIVLSDFRLPSFDGMAALKLVQEWNAATPFILVSGTIGEEMAVEALKRGVTDYVLKDRLERLDIALTRALRERHLKETEVMLRQAQKMESMGRLAGGVAHDFNNILTAILGLSELAISALPKDSPVQADLEEIRLSGLRAANLTQQLLAFSRRQVTSPRIIDLDATIQEVSKMLRRIIGEHIELQLEPGARGATIKADPGQIEQLVMNLAVNARDAMPQGGTITLRTEVEEVSSNAEALIDVPPGRYIRLTVADTGTGMTAEALNHLFEPFFTTKEKGKGTGLGLATCYGVVKQSGGAIRCHSAPGTGTTFSVLLPCVTGAPHSEKTASRSTMPKGGETILVVEDEEPVRRLTTRILRGLGYTTIEAADGEAALALLKSPEADAVSLLLTDLVMPRMSGWELASQGAKLKPRLAVLFVSGYTDDTLENICLLDGGSDILTKPFTAEDLAGRVRAALDMVRPAEQD